MLLQLAVCFLDQCQLDLRRSRNFPTLLQPRWQHLPKVPHVYFLLCLHVLDSVYGYYHEDYACNNPYNADLKKGYNLRQDESYIGADYEHRQCYVDDVEVDGRAGAILVSLPERKVEHDKAGCQGQGSHKTKTLRLWVRRLLIGIGRT